MCLTPVLALRFANRAKQYKTNAWRDRDDWRDGWSIREDGTEQTAHEHTPSALTHIFTEDSVIELGVGFLLRSS